MDQAEPQPLPGQPPRYRPGRLPRRWLRPAGGSAGSQPVTGWPDPAPTDPAHPGDPEPSGPREHRGPGADPAAGADGLPGDAPDGAADGWAQWAAAAPDPVGETEHPVVAGYDGSDSSRNALAYAAGMARRLGRSLLVAYVTTPGVFCEPMSGQVIAALRDGTETQRWLLAELDESCDRAGLDVRIVTRQGRPARELAAVAVEFNADALVIGAPCGLWHHVAGSVPAWLTRHAHCPVIVVP